MASAQKPLFAPPPPELEGRQNIVRQAVKDAGHDGVTAAQAGAILHERAGKHPADERCTWCVRDGGSVLTSKNVREHVKRRQADGRFVLRDLPPLETSQTNEFPPGF